MNNFLKLEEFMRVINKKKDFCILFAKIWDYKTKKDIYSLKDILNKKIKLYKMFEALWDLFQDIQR